MTAQQLLEDLQRTIAKHGGKWNILVESNGGRYDIELLAISAGDYIIHVEAFEDFSTCDQCSSLEDENDSLENKVSELEANLQKIERRAREARCNDKADWRETLLEIELLADTFDL